MRPDFALFALENLAGAVAVPAIYCALPRPVLAALARECVNGTPDQPVPEAWRRERLGTAMATPDPAETVATVVLEPLDLVGRAMAKPRRLSTMARRRTAFLYYLARCPTVTEAAARTGIDRRSAQRWYEQDPDFADRWDAVVERRRKELVDDVVLGAGQAEVREIFFRGRKVGEYTRRDRALQLYLLKQADARRERAEAQREFDPGYDEYEDYEDEAFEAGDFDGAGDLDAAAESGPEMSRPLRLPAPVQAGAFASNPGDLAPDDCDSGFSR